MEKKGRGTAKGGPSASKKKVKTTWTTTTRHSCKKGERCISFQRKNKGKKWKGVKKVIVDRNTTWNKKIDILFFYSWVLLWKESHMMEVYTPVAYSRKKFSCCLVKLKLWKYGKIKKNICVILFSFHFVTSSWRKYGGVLCAFTWNVYRIATSDATLFLSVHLLRLQWLWCILQVSLTFWLAQK